MDKMNVDMLIPLDRPTSKCLVLMKEEREMHDISNHIAFRYALCLTWIAKRLSTYKILRYSFDIQHDPNVVDILLILLCVVMFNSQH